MASLRRASARAAIYLGFAVIVVLLVTYTGSSWVPAWAMEREIESREPPPARDGELVLLPLPPTPLRPPFGIRFQVARERHLRLRILDPEGRPIRELHHGGHPAGIGQVVWDGYDDRGRRVPAGPLRIVLASRRDRVSRPLVLRH